MLNPAHPAHPAQPAPAPSSPPFPLATWRQLLAWGLSPIPVKPTDKRPDHDVLWRTTRKRGWKDFQSQPASDDLVRRWAKSRVQAVATVCGAVAGGLLVLDFDDPALYPLWRARVEAHLGPDLVSRLTVQRSGGGGYHVFARCPQPGANDVLARRADGTVGIETRGEGGYILLAGSRHPSGGRYEVIQGSLGTIPTLTQAEADALLAHARALGGEEPRTFGADQRRGYKNESNNYRRSSASIGGYDLIARYNAAHPIETALERYGYRRVGDRFVRPGGQSASVVILDGKSYHHSANDPLHDDHAHDSFDVMCHYDFRGDRRAALRALQDLEPPTEGADQRRGFNKTENNQCQSVSISGSSLGRPLTDLGNAERLVARYGPDLRYCRAWGKWLVWDEQRWAVDETGRVWQWAKATVRAIADEAALVGGDDDEAQARRRKIVAWAQGSEARARIEALVRLAQSEAAVTVRPAELDADPWLFNVLNGTLDLRTGELRPHRREDLITKLAPVAYDPDATCPRWERFLAEILGGDEALIGFVQRGAGWSLTGDTREQVLLLMYGSGQNGKTTFLETMREVWGDYGQRAPTELLLARRERGIPNDVARLKGARLVTLTEVGEGRRLDEALVKELTGGDTLVARFLNHEYFEFKPQAKLWLATNHMPSVQGTDHALWRRMVVVPFTVRIEQVDPTLPEKLSEERAGILAWAVRGCLAWQREGLAAPARVREAVAAYRGDMDSVGRFIEDCCVLHPDAVTATGDLYRAYSAWCAASGERALAQAHLGRKLVERGLVMVRQKTWRGWRGLGVLER